MGEPIEIGDDVQVQAVVKGLIDAYKTPAEKLSDPETMAQEVGWFHKPLVSRNPRFVHGIKQVGHAPELHAPALTLRTHT